MSFATILNNQQQALHALLLFPQLEVTLRSLLI